MSSLRNANLEDRTNFEALGAIPKKKILGRNIESNTGNREIRPTECKSIDENEVDRIYENIANNIEIAQPSISTILDFPKLELKQPKIIGYFEKTAEKLVHNEPILPRIGNFENQANVNVKGHQTNIDNIIDKNIEYPGQILETQGKNIAQNPNTNSVNPPGRKYRWERFSDIPISSHIVRLPNLPIVKSQSDSSSMKLDKEKGGRKKKFRKKKEAERTEDCSNPIWKYFPKLEVSKNQSGKRKINSQDLEVSKKFRVGSSD